MKKDIIALIALIGLGCSTMSSANKVTFYNNSYTTFFATLNGSQIISLRPLEKKTVTGPITRIDVQFGVPTPSISIQGKHPDRVIWDVNQYRNLIMSYGPTGYWITHDNPNFPNDVTQVSFSVAGPQFSGTGPGGSPYKNKQFLWNCWSLGPMEQQQCPPADAWPQ